MLTANQIVRLEPPMVASTTLPSSATSAAPTGFPLAEERAVQTLTTGGAFPCGSTTAAVGFPVRMACLRSGLERRRPTLPGCVVENKRRPSRE